MLPCPMRLHPALRSLCKIAAEKAFEVLADRLANMAADHLEAKFPPKSAEPDESDDREQEQETA